WPHGDHRHLSEIARQAIRRDGYARVTLVSAFHTVVAHGYNPAALSHLNTSETTHAQSPRACPRLNRHAAVSAAPGSIAIRQRSAGTDAQRRSDELADHEDHAHVHRCVRAATHRFAES